MVAPIAGSQRGGERQQETGAEFGALLKKNGTSVQQPVVHQDVVMDAVVLDVPSAVRKRSMSSGPDLLLKAM